ncbi:5'-methylthioadenosine/S-adenosylhomocysteine nucleosidase [Priestia koreensis]|uniref:5'-methylthioadenosine/S-adenosylhomocysteine nucleosidase n=1 Tax=Priestia koreensis TaxID=284581 RepID=A0A0M0KYE9_9BACI|nr:5'-methylthioadenosine/S-adenosylhomocysteine nucleosidase [Priestia koreensis]KOO43834.1 5'-methylthioadenosine nucleosidase [Priestia koreensis]
MKVAIIGAMEEEVTILRDKLENLEQTVIGGSEYSTGTIDGVDIVLLKSGIGKVNAALSTAVLLEKFKPDYVVNTGSAGGFHPELNVGDAVISTEVRHHDVDVTIFNYEYGQVPGMPAAFLPEEKLVRVAEEAAKEITDMQIVKGLIATGDSFMNDPVRVEFVREKFPNLYAAEMEAAAIAQVCHQFETPFVIIRALSDIAGKESNVSFDQFLDKAALNSASLVLGIVNQLTK